MSKLIILLFILLKCFSTAQIFSFNSSTFLLNNTPFTIRSGELHFARIPPEYWRHRLQMARSMGLNTIATYVFWNYHQPTEAGPIDFESPTHDLAQFLKIAQEEGLFVLLRPGPYVCGEWDFGGLPHWLLKYDDIKVRAYDMKYLGFVKDYFKKLAEIIIPLQINNGGPIIMVQIENEFGYFAKDPQYLDFLQNLWLELGVIVPFYTADNPWLWYLAKGHVQGAAIGLDAGNSRFYYAMAYLEDSEVVSFSSETYPGWLTHWGEKWAVKTTREIYSDIQFILDYGKSFNLYMLHGGTNFGFWAGANDGYKGYQPHITSYDYDAPVTENGNATEKFWALRDLIQKYVKEKLPDPPEPIETIEIGRIELNFHSSVWDEGFLSHEADYPKFFEFYDQFSGVMIYRTNLSEITAGYLKIDGFGDYAMVFVDDEYLGTLDRGQAEFGLVVPDKGRNFSKLEVLVEGMGRINFGSNVMDRKGIKGNVSLDGNILKGWHMTNVPFDERHVEELMKEETSGKDYKKQGIIYKGKFGLDRVGDTFINVAGWEKGIVFVNGRNLGRFWKAGPQFRLYCPASYLRIGENVVVVFDLHRLSPGFITGERSLK